jgi:hypothetical protein
MPRRKKSIIEKIEKMQDIEAIQSLLKEMKPLLIKAGIKDNIIKKVFNIEPQRHKELRHYLTELYIREYTLYKRSYNELPEHAWNHYELTGVSNQPEQIDLAEKAKALARAWRDRPKKKKAIKKEIIND